MTKITYVGKKKTHFTALRKRMSQFVGETEACDLGNSDKDA